MMPRGYIGPGACASSVRETVVLREAYARGLHVALVREGCPAVRVTGPGVDVTAAALRFLSASALRPAE